MTEPADPDEPVSYVSPLSKHEYVLFRAANEAESAIKRHPEFPSGDRWSPGGPEWMVFARPMLPHLRIPLTDLKTGEAKLVETVLPDSATIFFRFTPSDSVDGYARGNFLVRRIYRFFAAFAGEEIPIRALILSPAGEGSIAFPREELQASARWLLGVFEKTVPVVEQTRECLKVVPTDARLARAIDSIGASILSSDYELKFFHSWGALELLARNEYAREHSGVDEIGPDGRTLEKFPDDDKLVVDLLRKVQRPTGRGTVKKWVHLRAGVAHGGRNERDYVEIWRLTDEIHAKSREALAGVLGNIGGPPVSAGDFHARVMVQNWDGAVIPYGEWEERRRAKERTRRRSSRPSRGDA